MIQAIVFFPLIGALIAGLLGRVIGHRTSEYATTGLLVVAALLSWIVFAGYWFAPEGVEHTTTKVEIMRFENEAEDLLRYLKSAGLAPGLKGTLESSGDEEVVMLSEAGDQCAVTRSVAETVAVIADPSPPSRTALPEHLVMSTERYGR